jgi:uncharacterized RDD family membrane protein YckC
MACITDFGIVGAIFLIFIITTFGEMPEGSPFDKRVIGIYGVCFLALVVVYFLLFMLSASQTPGMKARQLVVVTKDDELLDPKHACMRGLGYLVSILPVLLGLIWVLIDLNISLGRIKFRQLTSGNCRESADNLKTRRL